MTAISINQISYAISSLEREADRAYDRARRTDDYDHAKSLQRLAQAASAELAVLSKHMDSFRSYLRDKGRAYDLYVTSPRRDDEENAGCSCHINPPCGSCVRDSEEEGE